MTCEFFLNFQISHKNYFHGEVRTFCPVSREFLHECDQIFRARNLQHLRTLKYVSGLGFDREDAVTGRSRKYLRLKYCRTMNNPTTSACYMPFCCANSSLDIESYFPKIAHFPLELSVILLRSHSSSFARSFHCGSALSPLKELTQTELRLCC